MTFDPGDLVQHRFVRYGPSPLPDVRDGEIEEFVAGVQTAGDAAVRAALAIISEAGRRVLCAYAERSASLAIRNKTCDGLVLALIALVIGGLDKNSVESLMRMALVEDAMHRLGCAPADLFEKAATAVGHPGTVQLALWLARRPEERTPKSMGYVAGCDESGFRYNWATQ